MFKRAVAGVCSERIGSGLAMHICLTTDDLHLPHDRMSRRHEVGLWKENVDYVSKVRKKSLTHWVISERNT